jgi:hypothetical protein
MKYEFMGPVVSASVATGNGAANENAAEKVSVGRSEV